MHGTCSESQRDSRVVSTPIEAMALRRVYCPSPRNMRAAAGLVNKVTWVESPRCVSDPREAHGEASTPAHGTRRRACPGIGCARHAVADSLERQGTLTTRLTPGSA